MSGDHDLLVRVSSLFRLARKAKKQKQSSMARLLETSQANLSKIEAGKIEPGAKIWGRFCKEFCIDPDSGFSEEAYNRALQILEAL